MPTKKELQDELVKRFRDPNAQPEQKSFKPVDYQREDAAHDAFRQKKIVEHQELDDAVGRLDQVKEPSNPAIGRGLPPQQVGLLPLPAQSQDPEDEAKKEHFRNLMNKVRMPQ